MLLIQIEEKQSTKLSSVWKTESTRKLNFEISCSNKNYKYIKHNDIEISDFREIPISLETITIETNNGARLNAAVIEQGLKFFSRIGLKIKAQSKN